MVGALVATAVVGGACKEQPAPEPRARAPRDARATPRPDVVPRLRIGSGAGLVFSFFDRRAELATVDRIQDVVETARAEVLVTDPRSRLPGDLVYVADLRGKDDTSGQYRVWVESRGRWYDRNMPKKSMLARAMLRPGDDDERKARKPRRRRRKRRKRRRRPRTAVDSPSRAAKAPGAKQPQVVLFTTAWCPSCKSARRYFQSKGLAFEELDVERDQRAQQAYLQLVRRYRLREGVVPLLIVNGRIFQGFSKPQVEAALAAPPPRQG